MSFFNYQGKKIYYTIIGEGEPLVFLHGNTSSSKLFEPLLPLYKGNQVILIDFLGYGQSDRVESFPTELWKDEAQQVISLLDFCQLPPVNLLGTSGGAWVALNVALTRSDLVAKVVADSFDGRTLHSGFRESLVTERTMVTANPETRIFYEWCIGKDWEQVVARDTDSLLRLIDARSELFSKPLETLEVPLLLLGSKEDPLLRKDLETEYQAITKACKNSICHLFEHGGHPAIGTNAQAAAKVITCFIES
ncbi:alpha/beta fold hydrolase [Enterococcus alishanensis]|uniref:Alpha/beta hydrolase n=1 Tax=Enterococcus alishanensis TaxID=1303817 RepID=A0ABS6TH66_9ENTE|nr:alpha/beta hydrolase [Enterococcus alishanensis]MBV7392217.1 alpha/beta hydrolase [Enterococcus alishanensis]